MKKLILSSLFTIVYFASYAQSCTPGANFVDSTYGVWPSPATNFPAALVSVPYTTDVNFKVPSTITDEIAAVIPEAAMLVGAPIQSFKITNVSGLPAGFAYVCNISSCEYLGGSNGCANIYGTSVAAAGSYPAAIEFDITVLISFTILLVYFCFTIKPVGTVHEIGISFLDISFDTACNQPIPCLDDMTTSPIVS